MPESDAAPRRSLRRRFAFALAAPPLLLAWCWVAGSLAFFSRWPAAVGLLACASWILGSFLACRRFGLRRTVAVGLGFAAPWCVAYLLLERPRTDRKWTEDQARTVSSTLSADGRWLEVENVRDFRWRTVDDFDARWDSRRYDLDALTSLDYIIEPLPALPGMAHVLLSFGFEGGDYLAVSVEIRKEEGESFSPLAGLFRRYELAYVVADERDVLALRLNVREHELIVHPLRATPEQTRALLLSLLRRAETLATEPEFYNTLTSTCTTNVVHHLEELLDEDLPWDWRAQLPLHSDALAWELGLIDGAQSLEEARRRGSSRSPLTLETLPIDLRVREQRRARQRP